MTCIAADYMLVTGNVDILLAVVISIVEQGSSNQNNAIE